ncbi:MAG: hypothetical protein ABIR68_05765 [Ilumatobacteraceae bacterium]
MTAAASSRAAATAPSGAASTVPVIVAADLAAGHDGLAEVLVGIRYPNGAERAVSLACEAVDHAVAAAGVATLAELIGQPWTILTHPCDTSIDSNTDTCDVGAT